MHSTKEIQRIIGSNFPSFDIRDISLIGEGWDNFAYRVNQDYIFRFPKNEEMSKRLRKETCILPKLESILDLPIPHFEFIGKKSRVFDKYFTGHKAIQGVPLTREILHQLSNGVKGGIAKQISRFLEGIHSFPLEEATACGIEELDFRKKYREEFKDVQEKVLPRLSECGRRLITELIKDYITDEENFKYISSLIHADLHARHILFDMGQDKINGIIDFGDLVIGDPDYDLTFLLEDYGKDFINLLLKHYPCKNALRLMKKLEFFLCWDEINSVLYGTFHEDQDKIDEGLGALRRRISRIVSSRGDY